MWVVMRHEVLFAVLTLASTRSAIAKELTMVVVLVYAIARGIMGWSGAATTALATAATLATTTSTIVLAIETEAVWALVVMWASSTCVVLTHTRAHGSGRTERPTILHARIPVQMIDYPESLYFMRGRFAWNGKPGGDEFPLKLSATFLIELRFVTLLLGLFRLGVLLQDVLHCHLIVLSHWLRARWLLLLFFFFLGRCFLRLIATASHHTLEHLCSSLCDICDEFSFRFGTRLGAGLSSRICL